MIYPCHRCSEEHHAFLGHIIIPITWQWLESCTSKWWNVAIVLEESTVAVHLFPSRLQSMCASSSFQGQADWGSYTVSMSPSSPWSQGQSRPSEPNAMTCRIRRFITSAQNCACAIRCKRNVACKGSAKSHKYNIYMHMHGIAFYIRMHRYVIQQNNLMISCSTQNWIEERHNKTTSDHRWMGKCCQFNAKQDIYYEYE